MKKGQRVSIVYRSKETGQDVPAEGTFNWYSSNLWRYAIYLDGDDRNFTFDIDGKDPIS